MVESSEKVYVKVDMTQEEIDILDAARGKVSRSEYMHWKIFGDKKIKERRQ